MTEVQECTFNVARHGKINGVVNIVPGDGEATVASGCPIFAGLVVLL